VQTGESDEGLDAVDGFAVRRDEGCQSTGGDNEGCGTLPLPADTTDHTIDAVHGAEEYAGLQRRIGTPADDVTRGGDGHTGQLCGAADESFRTCADTGRDDAADEYTVGGNAVECRCSTEINHDAVALEEVSGGKGVEDAVGADGMGFIDIEAHRQWRTGVDDESPGADMAIAHLGDNRGEWRNDRPDDGGADLVGLETGLTEERADQEAEFVGSAVVAGGDTPVLHEVTVAEEAHDDFCVADVEDEDHDAHALLGPTAAGGSIACRQRSYGRAISSERSRAGAE
jgi:hypothetical protein